MFAVPLKEGFNLIVWIVLIFVVVVGVVVVVLVVWVMWRNELVLLDYELYFEDELEEYLVIVD